MKEILFEIVLAIISVTVTILLSYLGSAIKKFIDAKISSSKLNEGLIQILDLIMRTVMSTSQTYVDSLKATGSFDAEAQKKAFNDTKSAIMHMLSEKDKDLILSLYQDLDMWIDIQIEAAVRNLKSQ